MSDTILIARSAIRTDGGMQPRFQLSQETIERYADAMREGERFPPLEVVYDGTDYWLWDGLHRINAGDTINKAKWDVHVTQGSQSDAVWLSYSANGQHGLPRTRAEIERAVISALQHPNGKNLSDSAIAKHTQTTKKQVQYIRTKLKPEEAPQAEVPQPTQRIGTDGKTYTVPPPRPPAAKSTPAPAAPPPLKDKLGRTIDKADFYNLVTAREAMAATRQRLIEAKQEWEAVTKAIDSNPKAAQFARHPLYKSIMKIVGTLPEAILDVGKMMPATSCTYCKGEGKCEVCHEARWITEQQFEDCPTEVQAITGPTFAQFRAKKKVAA